MLNTFQQNLASALKDANVQICLDLIAQCKDFTQINYTFGIIESLRTVTPLHLACENAALLPVAQVLIACGAALEAKDDQGRTPLICATIQRNQEAVSLLLGYNANVNAIDNAGNYAKDYADCPRHEIIASVLENKSFPTLFSILAKQVAIHQLDMSLLPQGVQGELKADLVDQKDHHAAKTISESAFQYDLEQVRKRIRDTIL